MNDSLWYFALCIAIGVLATLALYFEPKPKPAPLPVSEPVYTPMPTYSIHDEVDMIVEAIEQGEAK